MFQKKKFLISAGMLAVGTTIGLTGYTQTEKPSSVANTSSLPTETLPPDWPAKYMKLDPAKAAERRYKGYKDLLNKSYHPCSSEDGTTQLKPIS